MAANKGGNDLDLEISNSIKDCECPISQEFMVDPVRAEDGHIYERDSINGLIVGLTK